jgi:hypothetical protein
MHESHRPLSRPLGRPSYTPSISIVATPYFIQTTTNYYPLNRPRMNL